MNIRAGFLSFLAAVLTTTSASAQSVADIQKLQYQYADLMKQGRFTEALTISDQALNICPPAAAEPLWYERGIMLRGAKKPDEAIQAFDKALALKHSLNVLVAKGTTLNELRRYPEAIDNYNQALQIDSANATVYASRGAAEVGSNQIDAALEDFAKAIKLEPNNYLAYVSRGTIELNRAEYPKARADLDKAIQLNPNDAAAYGTRAIVFWSLKNKALALVDAEKAAKLNPFYRSQLDKMQKNDISQQFAINEKVFGQTVKPATPPRTTYSANDACDNALDCTTPEDTQPKIHVQSSRLCESN